MTTETLLDERIKELDKSKRDLKLVAVKYQEVKSNLVCMYICVKCDQFFLHFLNKVAMFMGACNVGFFLLYLWHF